MAGVRRRGEDISIQPDPKRDVEGDAQAKPRLQPEEVALAALDGADRRLCDADAPARSA